jgi:hypothetical protein
MTLKQQGKRGKANDATEMQSSKSTAAVKKSNNQISKKSKPKFKNKKSNFRD